MDEKKELCNCGCEQEDCACEFDDEIVELTTDDGKVIKCFHLGTIEYKEKFYAAFEPAEEVEGISEEEIVIFEVAMTEDDSNESELLPVENEKLLDEVFEEFCKRLEEEPEATEEE